MAETIPLRIIFLGIVGIPYQVGSAEGSLADDVDLLCAGNSHYRTSRQTNIFQLRYVSSYWFGSGNCMCGRFYVFLHCDSTWSGINCDPHNLAVCCIGFHNGVYFPFRTGKPEKDYGHHLRNRRYSTISGLRIGRYL